MVKSITKHNVTKIPFYISVPNEEVALFQDRLKAYPVSIFGEQEIIKANPK